MLVDWDEVKPLPPYSVKGGFVGGILRYSMPIVLFISRKCGVLIKGYSWTYLTTLGITG